MSDTLGSTLPRLVLYLPHLPQGIEQYRQMPTAERLIAHNSNHWRKIVTIAAKIAAPDADWRGFRDKHFFDRIALCFTPVLLPNDAWHWIGGKANQARFDDLPSTVTPLAGSDDLFIDTEHKLLLTPYPDYRQFSDRKIGLVRQALAQAGFERE